MSTIFVTTITKVMAVLHSYFRTRNLEKTSLPTILPTILLLTANWMKPYEPHENNNHMKSWSDDILINSRGIEGLYSKY